MENLNSPRNNQEKHINIPEKVRSALKGMRDSAIAGSALIIAACSNGEKTNTPIVTETQSVTTTSTEVFTPQPTRTETKIPTKEPTDTPTVEPTTPVPTETTVVPTETPTATPTVETPTPTETAVESELPYEIGSELTIGNVTLAVTKDMQTRTECPDTSNTSVMTACPAMQELYLNTDEFPDAADKLQEGVKFGLYKAWVEEGQGDKTVREKMTFGQFKTELANERGQDLTFQVSGVRKEGKTDSINGIITVDPRKPINFVWLAQPDVYSQITTSFGIDVREANSQIYIEFYDFSAGGLNNENWKNFQAAGLIEWGLVYLADTSLQTPNVSGDVSSNAVKNLEDFHKYLIPIKTPNIGDYWSGVVRAK